MPSTKRVQVLMEPDDFLRLDALAAQEGISVGELIRRAIRERYFAADTQRAAAADALIALALPALDAEHLAGAITLARTEGLR